MDNLKELSDSKIQNQDSALFFTILSLVTLYFIVDSWKTIYTPSYLIGLEYLFVSLVIFFLSKKSVPEDFNLILKLSIIPFAGFILGLMVSWGLSFLTGVGVVVGIGFFLDKKGHLEKIKTSIKKI